MLKRAALLVAGVIKKKTALLKLDKSKSWKSFSSIKHEVRSDTRDKKDGFLPENKNKVSVSSVVLPTYTGTFKRNLPSASSISHASGSSSSSSCDSSKSSA